MGVNSAADYTRMLQQLLPTGPAWATEPDAVLTSLLGALAEELARVEASAWNLLNEADPRTTAELLADWERVVGLPDPCLTAPTTLADRRNAVTTRLTTQGGQSRQFYIDLAANAGFTIAITEPALHTMQVNASATPIQTARAGSMRAGDQLRTWGVEVLECLINHYAPAHVVVLFAYA